jgi:hypothetical protein
LAVIDPLAREKAEAILADPAFEEALIELLRQSPDFAPAAPGASGALTSPELRLLAAGGIDSPAELPLEPLARAYLMFGKLMTDSLSTAEAAELLGVDGARIRQRLGERTLFGVKAPGGEWRLPRLQFVSNGEVPYLSQLLKALPQDLHPVEVFSWLSTPNADLELRGQELTPLQWLLAGAPVDVVAELAILMAEPA